MKIAVMSSSFHKPFRASLKLARRMGITGMQINLNGGLEIDRLTDRRVEKMRALLNRYQIEISAFCGDLGGHGFMRADENRVKVPKTKRMIDLAKRMHVPVITTHIGMIPDDRNHPVYRTLHAALTEIGAYAKENGVTLAIETGPERADTLLSFLESLNGGVGVNLDPANFVMVTGQDPVEAVRLLGKYIVHTHAKDGVNLRTCDPQEVYGSLDPHQTHRTPASPVFRETPLGEGGVDWDAYLNALREAGYDGYLTIERETRAAPYQTIEQAYRFLCQKLQTDPEKRVVLAVVGCGNIAKFAHFPAIQKIGEYRLKYCVDIVEERARKVMQKYGAHGYTKAITDYREALADEEVEAVIVCTHTHLHAQIAIEAMQAGKHVLSEKPVAMNARLAEQMLTVSQQTGKINNIGVCMRFDGAVNAIRDMISSGELGEVYSVYCSFREFRNIPAIGGEFTNRAHAGGGVLFDWGVHYLDLILYCTGQPDILTASANTYSKLGSDIEHYQAKKGAYNASKESGGVYDVEEYVTGFVRTAGPSISFNGAWAQNIDHKETYIDFMGTKGGIRLQYCAGFEWFTERNGKLVCLKPSFQKGDMYEEEHRAFVNDILHHTHSRAYIQNLLSTARLLDALYQSAQNNAECRIES